MTRLLLIGASTIALGWVADRVLRPRSVPPPPRQVRAAPADPGAAIETALMRFVVPVWLAAGVADWACHKRDRIETSTGAPESMIHLLMLAEVGLPTLAALFFEITEPVAALMIAAFLVHEATALWDVSYASARRRISPVEQHVHSFLELMPLLALTLFACRHAPAFRRLLRPARAEWRLRRRRAPPPSGGYVAGLLGAIALLELAPFAEELVRCLAAARADGRAMT